MKITGGKAGGLTIDAPPGKRTRPTSDRVRESLFSSLGPFLEGSRVLDLFAGSGALGLESASRGAASVDWVEQHAPTCARIRENVAKLPRAGVEIPTNVHAMDAFSWLRKHPNQRFDLIFADPPYALLGSPGACASFLSLVRETRALDPEGILVLETGPDTLPLPTPGWSLLRRRDYGSTSVWLLESDSGSDSGSGSGSGSGAG